MLERFSLFQSILHRKKCGKNIFNLVLLTVVSFNCTLSSNKFLIFWNVHLKVFQWNTFTVPLSCMELPSQPASPHLAYSVNGGSVGSHNRHPAKLASSLRHCSVILGTFVSVIAGSFLCSHFLLQSRTCQESSGCSKKWRKIGKQQSFYPYSK